MPTARRPRPVVVAMMNTLSKGRVLCAPAVLQQLEGREVKRILALVSNTWIQVTHIRASERLPFLNRANSLVKMSWSRGRRGGFNVCVENSLQQTTSSIQGPIREPQSHSICSTDLGARPCYLALHNSTLGLVFASHNFCPLLSLALTPSKLPANHTTGAAYLGYHPPGQPPAPHPPPSIVSQSSLCRSPGPPLSWIGACFMLF